MYGSAQALDKNPEADILPSEPVPLEDINERETATSSKEAKVCGCGYFHHVICNRESNWHDLQCINDRVAKQSDVYKIVVALNERHPPKDLVSRVELRKALSYITIRREDDPSVV